MRWARGFAVRRVMHPESARPERALPLGRMPVSRLCTVRRRPLPRGSGCGADGPQQRRAERAAHLRSRSQSSKLDVERWPARFHSIVSTLTLNTLCHSMCCLAPLNADSAVQRSAVCLTPEQQQTQCSSLHTASAHAHAHPQLPRGNGHRVHASHSSHTARQRQH